MHYLEFTIENYRAIKEKLSINISKERIIPLIGINECGKTTILQAIYCFDYSNDSYNEGRQLKDVMNLYELDHSNPAKISARLSVSCEEFKDVYNEYSSHSRIVDAQEADDDTVAEQRNIIAEQQKKLIDWWGDKRELYITRTLSGKECRYTAIMIDGKSINEQLANTGIEINDTDSFIKALLIYGPHILYSDDFNDRPPTDIEIPIDPEAPIKDEWQNIYNTLFQQSSTSSPKLSLYSVANETDRRNQKTRLAHIENSLNQQLKDAWRTFLPRKERASTGQYTIHIEIDEPNEQSVKMMHISVAEESTSKKTAAKTFNVTDRSKGFIWYFTLVMKIYYNPKAHRQRSNSNTIFLLDEPGSYLHADAQSELCKKLKSISESQGAVIYCTHTPHLLNPKYIATHKVRIVEKDNNNNIHCKSPALKSSNDIPGSEKPLFEALHLPYFHSLDAKKPFILVEGIYDAYTLRLFIKHGKHFPEQSAPSIVPGSSAHSIVQLLSYFIGFGFRYAALWDNDDEGHKKHTKAVEEFDDLEAKRFILLPRPKNAAGKDTKIEQMFAKGDIEKIAAKLDPVMAQQGTSPKSLYKKAILALFSANQRKQQTIMRSLSKETHDNFDALFEKIKKVLKIDSSIT